MWHSPAYTRPDKKSLSCKHCFLAEIGQKFYPSKTNYTQPLVQSYTFLPWPWRYSINERGYCNVCCKGLSSPYRSPPSSRVTGVCKTPSWSWSWWHPKWSEVYLTENNITNMSAWFFTEWNNRYMNMLFEQNHSCLFLLE